MVCVPAESKKRCVPVICPNCTQINFSFVYPEIVLQVQLASAMPQLVLLQLSPKGALLDSQITLFSYIGRTMIVKEIEE